MTPSDITALAEKLGPIAKVAWSAYVNQQIVIGHQEEVAAIAMFAVAIALFALAGFLVKEDPEAEFDGFSLAASFAAFIMAMAALVAVMWFTMDAAGHLSNPSYYAIQGILGR